MAESERPVCIIDVIGDEDVGKSTLIREWKKSPVFTELQKVLDVFTREYRTTDWKFPPPSEDSAYFHGYFLVYDNTKTATLDSVLSCSKTIILETIACQYRKLKKPPTIFLIANKDDLEDNDVMLGEEGDVEAHMEAGGISRWECTCATNGLNTEFPFARLIFLMLGLRWLRKMGEEACYYGCLNLVKILFHQFDEEELSNGAYAVQAFKGASDMQNRKLALPRTASLCKLPPTRRKIGKAMTASASHDLLQHLHENKLLPSPPSTEREPKSSPSDSLDVLSYLLSLNKPVMMSRLAAEVDYNPVLLGKILRQYYPQRAGGELKWRRLSLRRIHASWLNSLHGLTEIHLSHNKLSSVPDEMFHVRTVKTINLHDNLLGDLPDARGWQCECLSSLDLSQNSLKDAAGGSLQSTSQPSSTSIFSRKLSPAIQAKRRLSGQPGVQRLFRVNISSNPFSAIPVWILELPCLGVLDIRCTHLTRLPKDLANLRSLLTLKIDHDRICYPNKKILDGGVRLIREYLYNERHKSVPYYHISLFVLGNARTGKTTLLSGIRDPAVLKARKAADAEGGAGLRMCSFSLKPKGASHEITFHAVDFAGQEVLQSTHECCLSNRAVYLATWSAEQGKQGLLALNPWLLSIQARAPGAPVILVATHCDDLSLESVAGLEDVVQSVYPYQDGKALLNAKGLPAIVASMYVSLGQVGVRTGIHELRKRIYDTALTARSPQAVGKTDTYLRQQVPRSYTILQDTVVEKAKEMRAKQLPAIMEINDFWEMAQKANCQIEDFSSLQEASKFLTDVGVLLHFADAQGELPDYIFVDPQWLYDTIAAIVIVDPPPSTPTMPSVLTVSLPPYNEWLGRDETLAKKRRKGILRARWLPHILRQARAPAECHALLLRVLEHFHIVVALDSEHETFLVPALLPASAPRTGTLGFQALRTAAGGAEAAASLESRGATYPLSEALVRQYELPYVPSSFWSKLISSLVVLFTERKGASTLAPTATGELQPAAGPRRASPAASAGSGSPTLPAQRSGEHAQPPIASTAAESRAVFAAAGRSRKGLSDVGEEAGGGAAAARSGDSIDGPWNLSGDGALRGGVAKMDSAATIFEDSDQSVEGSDEPDGSLLKFRLKATLDRLSKRRSSSDFIGTMIESDDDFFKVQHPEGDADSLEGCACQPDNRHDADNISMLGSIISTGMGPTPTPLETRNDVAASPYLLTLLKCIEDDSRNGYHVSASQVHLVIRAWQTGIAVHIGLPSYSQRHSRSAAAAGSSALHRKFVEVRLEQLPGADSSGLQMAVWGHKKLQCCMMAQATYLTDTILEDWFPGLFRKVHRCVPCPKCLVERMHLTETNRFLPSQLHMFDFDRLMSAASSTSARAPRCDQHGDIDMRDLAPDVLLCDLASDLLLDADDFDDGLRLTDENKLGDGGFAQVYRARYRGEQVAVKVFTPKEDSRTAPYQELRTEVSALDQLQQEHVVKMIGACRLPLCLVLELAPCGSMSSVLRNKFKYGMPLNVAHRALFQVADALDYLHNLRIIYRDLKPQNILVWSVVPGKVLVKLADYGIATFALPAGIKDPQGTKGYMAPEVSAKSRVPYTEKADIFSLGMVIFEVVTGRRPYWEKPANFNMLAAQLAGYTPSLTEAAQANAEAQRLESQSSTRVVSPAPEFSEGYYDKPPMAGMLSPMQIHDEVDGGDDTFDSMDKRSSIFEFSDSFEISAEQQQQQQQQYNQRTPRNSRVSRWPSLDTPLRRPTSTPLRRRMSELSSPRHARAKPLPRWFRRTDWFNVHRHGDTPLSPDGTMDTDGGDSPPPFLRDGDQRSPVCLQLCFQGLVDASLYPSPQKRPSARAVASHLAICCCYPQPRRLRVTLAGSQKLMLCATALHADAADATANGSLWGQQHGAAVSIAIPDLALSPISMPQPRPSKTSASFHDAVRVVIDTGAITGASSVGGVPTTAEESSSPPASAATGDAGGSDEDVVDGAARSKQRRHAPLSDMSLRGRRLVGPSAGGAGRLSVSSAVSMLSVRRRSLLRRQDTFNETISLARSVPAMANATAAANVSGSGSVVGGSMLERQAPPPLPQSFTQFACLCYNNEVRSIDCARGSTQTCHCAFDGDEITAACCTSCDELWLGTVSGLVQAHSLPSLAMIGRNAVPAAVTCMMPLRGNVGLSILPASEVLVGAQDGSLARFYSTAPGGHAVTGLHKFVRRSAANEEGAVTCISHANKASRFCVIVGDNLLLVYDCVRWEERMRVLLDCCHQPVRQIVMTDDGLWICANQSPDLVLVDLVDGSTLKHICTRCELLESMGQPLSFPASKPFAKLLVQSYFHVESMAATEAHLWVLLSSGMLLVFKMAEDSSKSATTGRGGGSGPPRCKQRRYSHSLTTYRQAHHGPGWLQSLDAHSVCSAGLPVRPTASWLPLLLQESSNLPPPPQTSEENDLTLMQWELQT